MSGKQSTQGFTLIEVLIAMTLLSVMVILLFASLRTCAESWEKGESKIDDVNKIAVAYQFFKRHLTVTKPIWDDFTVAEVSSFAFQGTPQTLQFVGDFPASADRAGLQLFSIKFHEDNWLKPTDSGSEIKVSLTPFYPVTEGEESAPEEVSLIKNVTHFSMSYFGPDDVGGESLWQETWQEKEALPQLIKIKIELENNIYWPEMIFELKVGNGLNDDAGTDNSEENEDPNAESSDEVVE
jgi:general secretion pathway protein J